MGILPSLLRPKSGLKLRCIVVLAAALLVGALPAGAEKASSLYNKGRSAEARQDYEAAESFYELAYQQKPKDISYRAAVSRTRVLASAQHVHRGQQLRDQGQLEGALAEFKKASEVDPAGFIAQQEIRRTQVMIEAAKIGVAAKSTDPLLKQIEAIPSTPIELQPLSADPITLNLTEDAKVIYQILGKLAGINVLVDPEYTSHRIHVELHGVTLTEALSLVAVESKTYWQPMTSNTIFVTSDTAAKRKDLEPSIVKTFYLSNLSQPSDLQEIVTALHTIVEVGRMTALPSQGAILVRGTPDQVTLAGKLIDDLDKARPEVIIEVAIMQVNREWIRNLGVTLPTSATVTMTGAGNVVTSGGPSGTATFNSLGSLNATNFSVTLPSATANFLMSESSANLIQNPQIRALDGQKASLKIGERVPIAVGSFTAGSTATSALVNTQFQYIDVGVNIDITPTVHGSHEVTLKVSLDVSAVDSEVSVGGIQQPVIGQRKIEHTIRLKEGEVSLLGGLLENSQSKSISGYPGLINIPILKYLFGNENTDHRQTETVFVLIPHIVRIQDVNALNLKQLDVGTANNIELRPAKATKPEKPAVAVPSTSNGAGKDTPGVVTAAPATGTPVSVAPNPGTPPQTSQKETTSAPAQPAAVPPSVVFNINPAQVVTTVGQTFKVDVFITGAQDLTSVPLRIQYDPTLLQVVNAADGGFLGQDGKLVEIAQQDDSAKGILQVTATRAPNSGGSSGQGVVFILTFMAKAEGQATLSIVRAGLRDARQQGVPASGSPSTVEIRK
jgi:general secretion pathway protein D